MKFSRAAREVASNLLRSKEFKDGNQDSVDASAQEIDDIQIILDSSQNTVPIRSLVVRLVPSINCLNEISQCTFQNWLLFQESLLVLQENKQKELN